MSVYYKDERVTVLNGDVIEQLQALPDNSVNMCVTSPPYYGLRSYLPESHPDKQKEIGLEQSPQEYVEKMVSVFREVRRVLRDDGTLWLNLGDSYAHSMRQSGMHFAGKKQNTNEGSIRKGFAPCPNDFKEKDMLNIPHRVAWALQEDGWYLRHAIPWIRRNCLSGGTYLYAKTQKGEGPTMLKDLARLNPSTVQLWDGQKWNQVLEWVKNDEVQLRRQFRSLAGESSLLEIELRSGERIGCTDEHKWPTNRGLLAASELKIGDVIDYTDIPEPQSRSSYECLPDGDIGWLCGIYLAEGSLGSNDATMQLAQHVKEKERVERLRNIASKYGCNVGYYESDGNGATCNIPSRLLISVVQEYIAGRIAYDKHLTAKCWIRSNAFLRALLEGYLEGDGHYDKKNKRWRLGFCQNDSLARDIRCLASRLGVRCKLRRYKVNDRGVWRNCWRGEIKMEVENKSIGTQFIARPNTEVVAIRASRARQFWDVVLKDEPHLFALASGVLTHNSMPESVTDRPTKTIEYVFMLAKSQKYFYDQDAVKMRQTESSRERANYGWNGRTDDLSDGARTGSSFKQMASSGEGMKTIPQDGLRQRRDTDWFLESFQGLFTDDEGDPLALIVNNIGYSEAHFATFNPNLIRPLIKAGTSMHGCCAECGAPYEREIDRVAATSKPCPKTDLHHEARGGHGPATTGTIGKSGGGRIDGYSITKGWRKTCKCATAAIKRPVVLEPFAGSGTTLQVAEENGCDAIGIELNPEYCPLIVKRLRQQTLPMFAA